jgi:hypothetical protein
MITITGKVVFDAKEDKTENQRYRMYFMVLCNVEKYKDKQGEQKENQTWISCTKYSNEPQRVVEWIKKGAIVSIVAKQLTTYLKEGAEGEGMQGRINCIIDTFKIESFAPSEKPAPKAETAEIFTHQTEENGDLPF